MEMSFRSLQKISRLIRNPAGICRRYKSVNCAALKDDVNTELLNTFNRDIKAGGAVPVFRRALLFPSRVAIQDDAGVYTYAGLYQAASKISKEIAAQLVGETGLTIPYMCSNDSSHVIVQWAIWMSGNIAVPLTPLHPPDMLKYFLTDSGAGFSICTEEYEGLMRPITAELRIPLLVTGRELEITGQLHQLGEKPAGGKPVGGTPVGGLSEVGRSNEWYGGAEAMLIYTSGTTSKPKGVVWTHSMLSTQIQALHSAWCYSADDVVLHALPLHHIHGQLNSLNASLAAGARIQMLREFASHTVWAKLLGVGDRVRPTVLHGVPAMYAKLAAAHTEMFSDSKAAARVREVLAGVRLACAGSAPLPEKLFRNWEEITGIRLLERYGMSEVGMALSNPYRPVEGRTVGCVGTPLPGMAARVAVANDLTLQPLVTVETDMVDPQISLEFLGLVPKTSANQALEWKPPSVTVHVPSENDIYQGELLLKGPGVFTRYWNRAPKLDDSEFTEDGWFRTGDTVQYSEGRFRIMGRTSVDIIKTGGYKVSALQVESALLEHPNVADAAVLGIEHEDFGETVAAVVVTKDKGSLTLKDLKEEVSRKLAPYQLPRKLLIVEQMPRNIMGKLDKKVIREKFGEKLKLKK